MLLIAPVGEQAEKVHGVHKISVNLYGPQQRLYFFRLPAEAALWGVPELRLGCIS